MTRTHRALCVATTALLLLTACGGDNDDDADGAADTAASPDATASPQEGEDSSDDGSAAAENESFANAEIADVAGNPIGTLTAAESDEGVRLTAEVQDLTSGFHAIAIHENGVCEVQSQDDAGQVGDFYSAGEVIPGAAQEDPGVVEGEDELAETPGEEDADGEPPEGEAPEEDAPEGEAPEGEAPENQEQPPGEDEQTPPPQGAPAPNAAGEFTVQPAGQVPGGQGAVPPQPETQPQPEADVEIPRAERAGALPNLLINEDGTGHLEVISARLSQERLLEDEGAAVIIYTDADHHGNVPERYAPYGPDAGSLMTGDAGQRAACGVLEPAE